MLGWRLVESLDDGLDPCEGLLVGLFCGSSLIATGKDDDGDCFVCVVEDDELVVEAEI